ncbi:type I-MYXAN CRISPR-associated protein Cas6/Cmx6 [Thiocystis violacea]|uniref:type I-MYXAN CRISPR-associated protein Cas6/Cmx6 n=1 Tax=Thiocystis violacea TaxID=13725 RepID=UPI0019078E1D|nr:type I-MYXAN CRISPR-associated protein Cas6/Cmx6 [Thiocystis violacea]MBK1716851.1 type I-MYXAN CRISPR-associated protein Cas6/Cmx6 [Thiocystis violacea]
MYWNEDESPDVTPIPESVVDVLFAIECRRIPVEHAYPLAAALQAAVPWLADEPRVGVHSIHVAGSQNGWERPEPAPDAVLMVSRRTKLTIRAPRGQADRLLVTLPGLRLEIGGESLTIGVGKIRPLSQETTLFARYVAAGAEGAPPMDETDFLDIAVRALSELDIQVRKALCGKTTPLFTPTGILHTRSLMLAGLTQQESIRLQQQGLGPHRLMGCGIFIPHKGIDAVKAGS